MLSEVCCHAGGRLGRFIMIHSRGVWVFSSASAALGQAREWSDLLPPTGDQPGIGAQRAQWELQSLDDSGWGWGEGGGGLPSDY